MAPPPANKRKRPGVDEPGPRPSSHRPQDTDSAHRADQMAHPPNHRGGGDRPRGRGGHRGGRGGAAPRHPNQSRAHPSDTAPAPSARAPAPSQRNAPNASVKMDVDEKPAVDAKTSVDDKSTTKMEIDDKPVITHKALAPLPDVKISPHNPSDMDYEFLTAKILDEASGKSLGDLEALRQRFILAAAEHDDITVISIFSEITQAVFDKRIHAQEAGEAVRVLVDQVDQQKSRLEDLFLDAISVVKDADADNPFVPYFLAASDVPTTDKMRLILDDTLLRAVGLARDSFSKMFIRKQTNILYRQSNYNLLREESEGFAKVVTELFHASRDPNPTSDLVEQTVQKIHALIGCFDLDAGRVLDITFDVFSSNLHDNARFFVKYFRAGPYWPQPTNTAVHTIEAQGMALPIWALPSHESGSYTNEEKQALEDSKVQRDGRFWDEARTEHLARFFRLGDRLSRADLKKLNGQPQNMSSKQAQIAATWLEKTGLAHPQGNATAAQLLGFKLRAYDPVPGTAQQQPHVDKALVHMAALLIKIGFVSLKDLYPHLHPVDDLMPALEAEQRKKREEDLRASRPGAGKPNALLAAGALIDDTKSTSGPTAQAAAIKTEQKKETPLSVHGVVLKVELLKALLRVGAIPDALYILGRFPWLPEAFPDLLDEIHYILHYCIDKIHNTDLKGPPRYGTKILEWDDWANDLPICHDVSQFFVFAESLLNISGVLIGKDHVLFTKIVRIAIRSLKTDTTTENRQRWCAVIQRVVLPALTLTSTNYNCTAEIWELLKMFDLDERFRFYAEWCSGATSRLPAIREVLQATQASTKSCLKRISKTNARDMARQVAKNAMTAPGAVFETAIGTLESYDNMIDVIVESCRYLYDIHYDVLTFKILDAMTSAGRSHVSDTGYKVQKWLQSISTFNASLLRRYPNLSAYPSLAYIFKQVRDGNLTDLRLFKTLITTLTGVTAERDFSEAHLNAMAGGEHLRLMVLRNLGDKRADHSSSAKNFLRQMTDSDMVGPLLIVIAQQLHRCIYAAGVDEPKILAETFDECTMVFDQYLDFLMSRLPDLGKTVPSVAKLIGDYQVEVSIAFKIHRRDLTAAISQHDSDLKASKQDGDETAATATEEDTSAGRHPIIEQLSAELELVIPDDLKRTVGAGFFTTFWQLDLPDVVAPTRSYEDERKRRSKEVAPIRQQHKLSAKDRAMLNDADVFLSLMDDERKASIRRNNSVRTRLSKEKDTWFDTANVEVDDLDIGLLQYCFIPRAKVSMLDAQYAHRMFLSLHNLGAPKFRTGRFLGKLFNETLLTNIIFCCSLKEAGSFGRFLFEILSTLNEWRSSKDTYEKKAYGTKKELHGFVQKMSADGKPETFLEYDDFRLLLSKWHQNLYQALHACLTSMEYMHIRNGIEVVKKLNKAYPAFLHHGHNLLVDLKQVADRELPEMLKPEPQRKAVADMTFLEQNRPRREDLGVSAFSARSALNSLAKNWRSVDHLCPASEEQRPMLEKLKKQEADALAASAAISASGPAPAGTAAGAMAATAAPAPAPAPGRATTAAENSKKPAAETAAAKTDPDTEMPDAPHKPDDKPTGPSVNGNKDTPALRNGKDSGKPQDHPQDKPQVKPQEMPQDMPQDKHQSKPQDKGPATPRPASPEPRKGPARPSEPRNMDNRNADNRNSEPRPDSRQQRRVETPRQNNGSNGGPPRGAPRLSDVNSTEVPSIGSKRRADDTANTPDSNKRPRISGEPPMRSYSNDRLSEHSDRVNDRGSAGPPPRRNDNYRQGDAPAPEDTYVRDRGYNMPPPSMPRSDRGRAPPPSRPEIMPGPNAPGRLSRPDFSDSRLSGNNSGPSSRGSSPRRDSNYYGATRNDRGPPRDDRGPPPRDDRGPPPRDDRGPPRDDRGPPRGNSSTPNQQQRPGGPPMRAPQGQSRYAEPPPARGPGINPERAALIGQSASQSPREERGWNHDRERRRSRSPARPGPPGERRRSRSPAGPRGRGSGPRDYDDGRGRGGPRDNRGPGPGQGEDPADRQPRRPQQGGGAGPRGGGPPQHQQQGPRAANQSGNPQQGSRVPSQPGNPRSSDTEDTTAGRRSSTRR